MRFQNVVVLVSLLMACFMLAAQCAKAPPLTLDVTITFNDLGDAVFVSEPSATVPCPIGALEACLVTLVAPSAGATIISATLPPFFHLAEPGTTGSQCLSEGPGPCVSDGLHAIPVGGVGFAGATSVSFIFMSDPPGLEPVGLPSCSAPGNVGGCQLTEYGTPQEAGTITWSDGTVDHIKVQLDVTPEPASLILLGSGLVMTGGFLRRRRRSVAPVV